MGTLDRNIVLRDCHTAALNDGCERSQLCEGFDQPSKDASHHPLPSWKLTRVIKSHSPCFQSKAAPIISGRFPLLGLSFQPLKSCSLLCKGATGYSGRTDTRVGVLLLRRAYLHLSREGFLVVCHLSVGLQGSVSSRPQHIRALVKDKP